TGGIHVASLPGSCIADMRMGRRLHRRIDFAPHVGGQCNLLLSTLFVLSATVSPGIAATVLSPALSVSRDRRGLLQQVRPGNQPTQGSRLGSGSNNLYGCS